jgi:hypothetical protein
MNGWDLLTWVAIVILFFGSIAVFVAFLMDLGGILRQISKD